MHAMDAYLGGARVLGICTRSYAYVLLDMRAPVHSLAHARFLGCAHLALLFSLIDYSSLWCGKMA